MNSQGRPQTWRRLQAARLGCAQGQVQEPFPGSGPWDAQPGSGCAPVSPRPSPASAPPLPWEREDLKFYGVPWDANASWTRLGNARRKAKIWEKEGARAQLDGFPYKPCAAIPASLRLRTHPSIQEISQGSSPSSLSFQEPQERSRAGPRIPDMDTRPVLPALLPGGIHSIPGLHSHGDFHFQEQNPSVIPTLLSNQGAERRWSGRESPSPQLSSHFQAGISFPQSCFPGVLGSLIPVTFLEFIPIRIATK